MCSLFSVACILQCLLIETMSTDNIKLLYKNISESLDALLAIIGRASCFIPTAIRTVLTTQRPIRSNPNPRVT